MLSGVVFRHTRLTAAARFLSQAELFLLLHVNVLKIRQNFLKVSPQSKGSAAAQSGLSPISHCFLNSKLSINSGMEN